ncbi:DUF4190 domain-containing protein [Amycolatopsis regifaucium]|uniref:DUF4190 domain-containing protein n=1 Tax=Amycolatopsis regifaucium TaxID=546365 RepID=A0A154MD19_9PSEU|nr:DUF4190 domain-containing protein [Amycolatopsis regifaucium]KZB82376.1 hypothetical protein AVL48_10710 [Amycolatopsis regifaucium]OKA10228.1 hypothetical protein ATP06_0204845 [Amycolatopsis regifaucium]SFG91239.1 protein of unknown function [Amycolatopsis regifaucium]
MTNPHDPYGQQQPYGLQPYQPPQQYYAQPYGALRPPDQGMAVASLVCSLIGLVMCFPAILGIVFGHIALSKAKRGQAGGQGMAQAGLVVGYVVTGLWLVPLILWFVFVVLAIGAAGVS